MVGRRSTYGGDLPASPADLRITQVVENLRDFLLELGRAGGGEERRDAVLDWTIGGSPIDYHNAVIPNGAVADADIAQSITLARQHDVPLTWHVTGDDSLCERLLARGFTDDGAEFGMAVPLAKLPPAASQATFTEVLTATDLGLYVDILGQGFGEGPAEARWIGGMYERLGYGPGRPWRHYLAYLDGRPAATTTAFTTGDICGIYFVFTLPTARKQGIGAAITRHALLNAGAKTGVLGASAMGEPVYRRLGFEKVCTVRVLKATAP
jgi:GNAT superfamily N-acetyltransferase